MVTFAISDKVSDVSAASGLTITVDYATGDSTAIAPGDYTATSGELTFSPGQTSHSFSVPITDDTLSEDNETINLTLNSPTNALLGTPYTTVLTIRDDDLFHLYLPIVLKN